MPIKQKTFKNATNNPPLKLGKGKLIKINWGEHEQQIKEIWNSYPKTYSLKSANCKMTKIKRLFDYDGSNLVGYCCKCRELNVAILKQKVDGAILITRFCAEHLPT